MNVSRARRYWRRWDRYVSRLARLSPAVSIPPGWHKAIGVEASWTWRKRERQARRDAHLVVDAILKKIDESRAAA